MAGRPARGDIDVTGLTHKRVHRWCRMHGWKMVIGALSS